MFTSRPTRVTANPLAVTCEESAVHLEHSHRGNSPTPKRDRHPVSCVGMCRAPAAIGPNAGCHRVRGGPTPIGGVQGRGLCPSPCGCSWRHPKPQTGIATTTHWPCPAGNGLLCWNSRTTAPPQSCLYAFPNYTSLFAGRGIPMVALLHPMSHCSTKRTPACSAITTMSTAR